MKSTIYLLLLSLLQIAACNKDNNSTATPPVGRWKFNPTLIQSYVNGNLQSTSTQNFEATDYCEFKTGGTAESRSLGSIQTFSYAVNGDSVTINQKKGKINTLTASTFSYTLSDILNANHYTTATWNLYK